MSSGSAMRAGRGRRLAPVPLGAGTLYRVVFVRTRVSVPGASRSQEPAGFSYHGPHLLGGSHLGKQWIARQGPFMHQQLQVRAEAPILQATV